MNPFPSKQDSRPDTVPGIRDRPAFWSGSAPAVGVYLLGHIVLWWQIAHVVLFLGVALGPRSRNRSAQLAAPFRADPIARLGLVFCLAATVARADSPMTVPAEGEPFAAELAEIDDRWKCTLLAAGVPRQLSVDQLVRWGTPRETTRGPVVVLGDGGLLVADITGLKKQVLAVDSPLFGPVELPLADLAGVVFHLPGSKGPRPLVLVEGMKKALDHLSR